MELKFQKKVFFSDSYLILVLYLIHFIMFVFAGLSSNVLDSAAKINIYFWPQRAHGLMGKGAGTPKRNSQNTYQQFENIPCSTLFSYTVISSAI